MAEKQNLIGMVFGTLTVVEKLNHKITKSGKRLNGVFWRCKCSCGSESIVANYALKNSIRRCSDCPNNNTRNNYLGKTFKTVNYGEFIVVNYDSSKSIDIEFVQTGYKTNVTLKDIDTGLIKDVLHPSVYGVGYLGDGSYKATNSTGRKNTPAYEVWLGMLKRCYNPENLKNVRPSYKDVIVCSEWHCFQTFADWFVKNHKEGYDLDKDLKLIGNKVYSPEYCSFIPREVNSLFTGTADNRELPRGVHFCNTKKKYIAQIHKGAVTKSNKRKQTYLGTYDTKEEAINAYLNAKTEHCRCIAEKYKDVICDEIYFNITNRVKELINYA